MYIRCIRLASAIAACLVVLTGCATPPITEQKVMCSAQDCRVKVYISCLAHWWPCKIWVDDSKVEARGKNVFWDLQDDFDGKRFQFDPNTNVGIRFKKSGNGFTCNPVAASRSFKCDNGKVPGEHEYGIKLIGPVFVKEFDPWVVN